MARAESSTVSTETTDGETRPTASDAYISPLADFLLLFLATAAAAVTVAVLL
ncbi:MAG: hypothetical protein ACI8TL_000803 [Natronomonas sp.]|jgi:hypothetical protein